MRREKVTRGSGNIFRDLGLPDADALLARADLAITLGVREEADQAKLHAFAGEECAALEDALSSHAHH